MADYEIIEADFQQFYNLDVNTVGFRRYARLFINLPLGSRVVQKYSPFKDWNWDKEIQMHILHVLDVLAVNYSNAHRKKGTAPLKVPPLPQPKYVEEAKKAAKQKSMPTQEEKDNIIAYFEKRNANVKKMEDQINGA